MYLRVPINAMTPKNKQTNPATNDAVLPSFPSGPPRKESIDINSRKNEIAKKIKSNKRKLIINIILLIFIAFIIFSTHNDSADPPGSQPMPKPNQHYSRSVRVNCYERLSFILLFCLILFMITPMQNQYNPPRKVNHKNEITIQS